MAEILCALNIDESNALIQIEQLPVDQRREVYSLAAEEIMYGQAALGDAFNNEKGCFMVRLDDGQIVGFRHGIDLQAAS